MTYHFSKQANDKNIGSAEQPFLTINRAATVALPGDTIIVHEGEYREWVDPKRGGSAKAIGSHTPPLRAKGSSSRARRPLPIGKELTAPYGKICFRILCLAIGILTLKGFSEIGSRIRKKYHVHTGEVYINGKSCYEADSLDDVFTATPYEWHWQAFEGAIAKLTAGEQKITVWRR